jgi:hypothetical protein
MVKEFVTYGELSQLLILAQAENLILKEKVIGLNKKLNDRAYEDYYRKNELGGNYGL